MPSTSSNASDMARLPAPPVSTSVPSMSKRKSEARVASVAERLALAANVAGSRPFCRRLFFELDALAFIQLVEAALYRAAMKKPLLSAIVTNKPEPPVANESLDGATRHPSLLGGTFAQGTNIKFRSTRTPDEFRGFTAEHRSSAVPVNAKRIRLCIRFPRYFTLTVMTWHAPGSVLWRSSPSWTASLCLPGVSWLSNTSLPSPKCTHDGVPLTIVLPGARQS